MRSNLKISQKYFCNCFYQRLSENFEALDRINSTFVFTGRKLSAIRLKIMSNRARCLLDNLFSTRYFVPLRRGQMI